MTEENKLKLDLLARKASSPAIVLIAVASVWFAMRWQSLVLAFLAGWIARSIPRVPYVEPQPMTAEQIVEDYNNRVASQN